MATNVEESDTDEHESSAPPKRICTRNTKLKDSSFEMEKNLSDPEDPLEEENAEDDDDSYAEEKFRSWHANQIATGSWDNTINHILEKCIAKGPPLYPTYIEHYLPEYQLIRGNNMEDTAVMMAIRNHGLVQSREIVSRSHSVYRDKNPGYGIDNSCNDHTDYTRRDVAGSTSSASNDSERLGSQSDIEKFSSSDWDADKVDDSNQQENFLERAVAEAIKKKGLSALSVDDG